MLIFNDIGHLAVTMSQRNLVLFFMSAVFPIHAVLSAGVGSNLDPCLSLDALVKIQCFEEQPFKCAPCGACCRGSEFCDDALCKSCFPSNVQEDGRLAWCRSIGQYNTSAMISPLCRLACQDLFNSTELAGVGEESCTEEKPFKCAPAGACCNGSEFCHNGLCESCFPLDLQKDGRLAWCRSIGQYSTSAMRSPLCRLACQDVFNSTELANVDEKSCTEEKPFKCAPEGACCTGSEFCDGGQCQTCFPSNVLKDERLAWCRSIGQYNTSAMKSPLCRLACQDIFNSTELTNVDDDIAPHTAASKTDDGFGQSTGIALFVTVLVLGLIIIAGLTYVIVKVKSLELVDCECYNSIRRGASQLKECMCCRKNDPVAPRLPDSSGTAPQPQGPVEDPPPEQDAPVLIDGAGVNFNRENDNQSAGRRPDSSGTAPQPQGPVEISPPEQVAPMPNDVEVVNCNRENDNQSAGNPLIAPNDVHLPPVSNGDQASLEPSQDHGQGKPQDNTASVSPTMTSVAEQAGSDGSRLNLPDEVSSMEAPAEGEAGVDEEQRIPLIIRQIPTP